MSDKTNTCPFCGSANISHGEMLSSDADGGNLATQSQCLDCGAYGPKAPLAAREVDYGDVKAIAAWNRRAQVSQPAQVGEWVKEAERLVNVLMVDYLEWINCKFASESTAAAAKAKARNSRAALDAHLRTRSAEDAALLKDAERPIDAPGLPARVLAMCKARGWSLHWTHRGAYLHLESSELIEALRGKRGDPLGEAADVLLVLMSITESNGMAWSDVLTQCVRTVEKLEAAPRYKGEEFTAPDAAIARLGAIGADNGGEK